MRLHETPNIQSPHSSPLRLEAKKLRPTCECPIFFRWQEANFYMNILAWNCDVCSLARKWTIIICSTSIPINKSLLYALVNVTFTSPLDEYYYLSLPSVEIKTQKDEVKCTAVLVASILHIFNPFFHLVPYPMFLLSWLFYKPTDLQPTQRRNNIEDISTFESFFFQY